jgi:uncharacterized protein YsxB (DUF464 family)
MPSKIISSTIELLEKLCHTTACFNIKKGLYNQFIAFHANSKQKEETVITCEFFRNSLSIPPLPPNLEYDIFIVRKIPNQP